MTWADLFARAGETTVEDVRASLTARREQDD